jgi:ferritin-like metal-binding protein YciE
VTIETFEDLFENMLRDVYDAEKQHTKALPKMAKMAANDELREAFEQHLEETHRQLERLEQVFEIMEIKGKGQKCEAAQGLIEEAQETMGEVEEEQVRDAGIIAAAQALEHYEIARYGTLVAWAQKLGEREAVKLLQESLREEHNANNLLNQLAEQTINEEAMHADDEEETGEEDEELQAGEEDEDEEPDMRRRRGGMDEGRGRQQDMRGREGRGREQGGRQGQQGRGQQGQQGRGQQGGRGGQQAGGGRGGQQSRNGGRSGQSGGRQVMAAGNRGSSARRSQAAGGKGDDLKAREYRDAQGQIRHHTRSYMERQRGKR